MSVNCNDTVYRSETLSYQSWEAATLISSTLACSAAPALLGTGLEHSTTQGTNIQYIIKVFFFHFYTSYNYSVWNTTDVGRSMEEYQEKCEAEITYNLEVESSLQWGEGDVEVSMEKEYE